MELFTLDGNFQLKDLIEDYSSLIWTERYFNAGEFELVATNTAAATRALPLESFVSLRDTNTVMVVEQHLPSNPLKEAPSITIKGRSAETVLERRASTIVALPAVYSAVPSWLMAAGKESDAAYKAMRHVIGDGPRFQGFTEVLGLLDPAVSPLDAIPELDLVLPADYSTSIANMYEIKPGNLYGTVLDLINTNHRGIKATRPVPGETKIGIEIYNGASLVDTVVFDIRFDQFDDAKYLLSFQGSANVAYYFGKGAAQKVLKNTGPEPSGLNRRVLLMDESADDATSSADVRRTRGLIELYKYNATAMFDGQLSEQVADGYNKHYFLGDIVKLAGDYGLNQNARVVEFVRSSDSQGFKSYPSFEAVDDV